MPDHTLYLVRHGHCDAGPDGGLTETGRIQARLVAAALKHVPVTTIYTSTMRRARETAAVFVRAFRGVPIRSLDALREAIPTPVPRLPRRLPRARVRAERARVDAAFERLFRPARRSRSDVIIAHGNVIRFLACRALGVKPIAWLRLGTTHCGITEVVIDSDGRMSVRTLNETQHLPRKLRTIVSPDGRSASASSSRSRGGSRR